MSLFRRPSLLEQRLRYRFIVTLKSGESIVGVLYEADDQVWVLRSAEMLEAGPNGSSVGIDGEAILPTDNIAFVQRP